MPRLTCIESFAKKALQLRTRPLNEGYTVAAATAGMTKRVQIGHMVPGNTYRNPALAAKIAATAETMLDYDQTRMTGFDVRFSAHVFPGDTQEVESWREGNVIKKLAHAHQGAGCHFHQ